MNLLLICSAGFTIFAAILLVAMPMLLKESASADRLQQLVQPKAIVVQPSSTRLKVVMARWTAMLRPRSGTRQSEQSREKLEAAGLRTSMQMDTYALVQGVAPLVGLFAGTFVPGNKLLACVTLAAAGYLGPDIWLRRRIRLYKERILQSLPDALDLLNICVEAGLGLDQAMLRVSEELALSHPELHTEFQRVQLEQRVGGGRMDAWKRFAERSDVEAVRSFVGMLIQSERFGTPISRSLSRFADDLRMQRKQGAEEAAAKTRVKIVFPLVFFIFPCLFLVLLAPAIISLFGIFKDLN
ncbi:type II secretion system F family protein [Terriglobus sp. ADX1]|uniref:type II secretion system F family protein n=1 Tax=Terriglobus sp. ADX1 TaxID=2794063 RepID=UPI002FE6ADE0